MEIKKGYRRAALQWHPDRHAAGTDREREEAERRFKEVRWGGSGHCGSSSSTLPRASFAPPRARALRPCCPATPRQIGEPFEIL